MKRLGLLVFFCTMMFSSAAFADGIDIKVKGTWDFVFGWHENTNFKGNHAGNREDDNFVARQRVRTQINFITSENLQAVLMFEIGNIDWGRDGGSKTGQGSGGGLDADGVNVETKRAYLDWMIPNTSVSVRMGIQGLALPMATGFHNPVFDADVAGIVVSAPINEMFAITAFWARPFNQNLNDGSNNYVDDETDLFGLILPITGDGWSVTPWGVYGRVGGGSGFYEYLANNGRAFGPGVGPDTTDSTNAWWIGVATEVNVFDPLTFSFDLMYGHLSSIDFAGMPDSELAARGWMFDARIDYKLDWGTPGIFGWYASGDDWEDVRDDGQLGRMPYLGTDTTFNPTTFGFHGGYNGISSDQYVSRTGTGLWGIGIQVADVSFIEDLSHTLRVAYYRGTNDNDVVKNGWNLNLRDALYLTDKDDAIEVNFDHKYKIYENLTAVLELGYIHLDLDRSTWGRGWAGKKTEDAWKAEVLFRYSF